MTALQTKKNWLKWKWRAGLALLAFVAYANSFGLGFAMDGNALVKDPRIHAVTAENLGLILRNDYWWPSSVDQLYRPVTTASLLVNYSILGNGPNAAGYHAVNFLLHVGNVWLVLELCLLLLGEPAALFAAALWAMHPIAVESVTNIAGRADLLSTMAVVGGLLLYIQMYNSGARWAALFVVSLLGVLAKENAAVLIGLMLLWDLSFGTKPKRWAAYAAVAASLVVALGLRLWVFSAAPWPELPWVDNPLRTAGFWEARWTAIGVMGRELALLVWPAPLAMDRAYDQIPVVGPGDLWAWISVAVIAGLIAVAVARRGRDPLWLWAVGFFGIALLPSSNLVTIIGSIMAERFLYLPSIAFAVALAALAYRLLSPRAARVAMCLAIALCAGRTMARNPAWNNDATLATADLDTVPRNFRVHQVLADSIYAADPRGNLDRAIQQAEIAWKILSPLPDREMYQQTPANLGLYYRLKGDAVGGADARGWYEKSLAVLLRAKAASLAGEKAYDEGQLAHGKPLTTRDAYLPVYLNLGATEMRLGDYAGAIAALEYARELDPREGSVYDQLAAVNAQAGNPQAEAIALEQKAAVAGLTAPGLQALERIYGADSCAIERKGNSAGLNLQCPEVHRDMCAAWTSLAEAVRRARIPEAARRFEDAAKQAGCK